MRSCKYIDSTVTERTSGRADAKLCASTDWPLKEILKMKYSVLWNKLKDSVRNADDKIQPRKIIEERWNSGAHHFEIFAITFYLLIEWLTLFYQIIKKRKNEN